MSKEISGINLRLFGSIWHSLLLLFCGYAIGAICGITRGVLIGWSSRWRYWGMPVLEMFGPVYQKGTILW